LGLLYQLWFGSPLLLLHLHRPKEKIIFSKMQSQQLIKNKKAFPEGRLFLSLTLVE